jgi:serine/threonine protein kinase
MWSIGVVMFILLGGYPPFDGPIEQLASIILKGRYEFEDYYWGHISREAKSLIASLLKVNPDKRISAEEALQSDWMTVEEETLTINDLSTAQREIKKSFPVGKVRGAVKAIIASNKLTSLGEKFTRPLIKAPNPKRSIMGQVLEMSMTQFDDDDLDGLDDVEGSSSGKPFLDLYELGDALGSGNFSTIFNTRHIQSNNEYAVKCIPRKALHPSDAVALQDEITALKVLKGCPYIVNLYDVFEEPDTSYVVLERMRGGDLIDRIIEKAHYTENDAKEVCKNLLEGVKHCHACKIANRNLKPENLLLVVSELVSTIEYYAIIENYSNQ